MGSVGSPPTRRQQRPGPPRTAASGSDRAASLAAEPKPVNRSVPSIITHTRALACLRRLACRARSSSPRQADGRTRRGRPEARARVGFSVRTAACRLCGRVFGEFGEPDDGSGRRGRRARGRGAWNRPPRSRRSGARTARDRPGPTRPDLVRRACAPLLVLGAGFGVWTHAAPRLEDVTPVPDTDHCSHQPVFHKSMSNPRNPRPVSVRL